MTNIKHIKRQKAFSLLELVGVVIIIGILIGLGIWRIADTRSQSLVINHDKAASMVNKLEQLAIVEDVVPTNQTTLGRLIELQDNLAKKGNLIEVFNPTNLAQTITYTGTNWVALP